MVCVPTPIKRTPGGLHERGRNESPVSCDRGVGSDADRRLRLRRRRRLTPAVLWRRCCAPASPRAVLDRYCVSCHNEKLRTGRARPHPGSTWRTSARRQRRGKRSYASFGVAPCLPPGHCGRTTRRTRRLRRGWRADLDRLAAARPNPGRLPAFHRLTRTEYRNAIRDLLALEDLPKAVDLESLLPADNSSTGFDNLADLLFVSTTQLEQYLSAAQKISRLAVGDPTIRLVDTYNMSSEHSQDVHVEDLSIGTRGGLAIRTLLPLDGEYNIHVELTAAPREPERLEVTVDGERMRVFTVSDKPDPDQAARPAGDCRSTGRVPERSGSGVAGTRPRHANSNRLRGQPAIRAGSTGRRSTRRHCQGLRRRRPAEGRPAGDRHHVHPALFRAERKSRAPAAARQRSAAGRGECHRQGSP